MVLFDVLGMKCGGCAGRVRKILEAQPYVHRASVNLATESAIAWVSSRSLQQTQTLAEQLANLLSDSGFRSNIRDKNKYMGEEYATKKRTERLLKLRKATQKVIVSAILAAICAVGHIAHCWTDAPMIIQFITQTPVHAALSAAVLLGPGRDLLQRGFTSLLKNDPDMDSLVALGATAAFSVSSAAALFPSLGWPAFFEEPAMLLSVVLLGRALEERAKLKASSDMMALHQLLPKSARLAVDKQSVDAEYDVVPAEVLGPGDTVLVLPGDTIPVDGVVVSGNGSVDESTLTGESVPVLKQVNDEVSAGTSNCDGALLLRAVRSGGNTTVAGIIRMAEEAASRTAPIQRLADRVAGKFTYGVMAVSAATFAFWMSVGTGLFPWVLAQGTKFSGSSLLCALQLGCSVMVVSCPCALGLATPTAVLVGTSLAAKRGILVRGGEVFEKISEVNSIVFDKTGTITEGIPAVVKVTSTSPNLTEQQLLTYAYSVEKMSTHPVARAVQFYFLNDSKQKNKKILIEEGSFQQIPGAGAKAVVDGKEVAVGTLNFVSDGKPLNSYSQYKDSESGVTRVFMGLGGQCVGFVDLVDRIRPESQKTVQELQRLGKEVFMLSGDRKQTAQTVAQKAGFENDKIEAEVTPEGKVLFVEKLMDSNKSGKVGMVGDGINDTAALAVADVGMAMGGGVDAAGEVADVVLLRDNPSQVLETIVLGKMTMNKIRQNLVWAFAYNAVCIPLAAGAYLPKFGLSLTPSISGALMGISSLAVMGNSLLLQWQAGEALKQLENNSPQKLDVIVHSDKYKQLDVASKHPPTFQEEIGKLQLQPSQSQTK